MLFGSIDGVTLSGLIDDLPEIHGYSAYQIALLNGFEGTEEEWLASLKGASGDGSGDMVAEIYDPQNKRRDIFKYVDDKVDAVAPMDVTEYIAAHNEDDTAHADIREAVNTAQNTADEAKETAEIAQAAATSEDLVKLIDDKLQTVGGIEVAMGGGDVRNLVIQKITESCTWTAPKAQDQTFKVFAVGGGGGGGNIIDEEDYPGGGGGGYVVIEELTIPEGESVDIVCGAGGAGGSQETARHGVAGGATSFGDYITADGGKGGTGWQNDGTQYTGGDGGAGGGGGSLFGGNGGTYGGGGGGGSGRGGGNGGTYGGGGGSGNWETDSANSYCVGGNGGTYGGNGGGAGQNGVGAQPGTPVAFSFSEHLGKEMSVSGKAGTNSVTSATSQRYGLGAGGGGYGGNGGTSVVSNSAWASGGGGGGGFGGNGGNGSASKGGGGGNYGGNGGNASSQCGGGGGGLFCNGADATGDFGGGGGGIFDANGGDGGSGGCYIMYFKEV